MHQSYFWFGILMAVVSVIFLLFPMDRTYSVKKGKADCSPLFAKQVIFQYLKITLKRSAFFLF